MGFMAVFHGVTLYWHCQHQSDTAQSAGAFAFAESVLSGKTEL